MSINERREEIIRTSILFNQEKEEKQKKTSNMAKRKFIVKVKNDKK